jgi:hypothetical protein
MSWRDDGAALATIKRGANAAHGPGDALEASGGACASASRSGPVAGDRRRVGTTGGAPRAASEARASRAGCRVTPLTKVRLFRNIGEKPSRLVNTMVVDKGKPMYRVTPEPVATA